MTEKESFAKQYDVDNLLATFLSKTGTNKTLQIVKSGLFY